MESNQTETPHFEEEVPQDQYIEEEANEDQESYNQEAYHQEDQFQEAEIEQQEREAENDIRPYGHYDKEGNEHNWAIKKLNWLKQYIPCLHEFRPGYLRMMFLRLLVVSVWCFFCLWAMSTMVVVAGIRYPKHLPTLPDLGFDLFPYMGDQGWVTNFLLYVTGGATIVRLVFHDKATTILRRTLFIYGLLLLGRCTTLVATNYPDPSPDCKAYEEATDLESFLVKTVYKKHFLTCGDLMYSGHCIYFTLQGLIWTFYSQRNLEKIVWFPIGGAILSLISTRVHYTSDVLIAFYATILIWYFYHLIATRPFLRKESAFISWFEQDLILYEESHPYEFDESLMNPCSC